MRDTKAGPLAGATCDPTPRHGFSSQCGSEIDGGTQTGDGGGTVAAKHACSVGADLGAGGGAAGRFGLAALAALGFLARRARKHARNARALTAAGCLVLATAGAVAFTARESQASVSVAVVFDELVRQSNAIAAVTPVERQTKWEDGRIVTYTRVRVDSLVAGELPQDVWVRTLGGVVDTIGQIVDGEPSFVVGQQSLVFLHGRVHGFEVTARAQGQFAIAGGEGTAPHLVPARNVGAILPPSGAVAGRFARDVLAGRPLADAAREISAAWTRLHTK